MRASTPSINTSSSSCSRCMLLVGLILLSGADRLLQVDAASVIGQQQERQCNLLPSWFASTGPRHACTDKNSHTGLLDGGAPVPGAISAALAVPRGGAWYFGKKTASRKFRQLLQEQVRMLDKQLRQSQEELALLRRQLKTSQSLLHRTGSPALRTKSAVQQAEKLKALAENQDLKRRVVSLTREVTQLEKMRDDLQAMIEKQNAKMAELEEKLKDKEAATEALIEKYEKQLQALKRDIESQYQQQLADLTKLMNKRVEEAAESARQLALKDLAFQVEKATAEERTRGEKMLAEEKRRSDAAVEREKVKMRKLAKALFEREKKLNTLDRDLTADEVEYASRSTGRQTGGSSSSSRSLNSSFKVDTVRGNFKP